MTNDNASKPDIRELSAAEMDDVAGASWLGDAWRWVKKHVGRGPGTVGVSVRGTF
ncbi:MAG: hypothetical protein AB7F78_12075 [Hyphomicrobiaceae bacterium]